MYEYAAIQEMPSSFVRIPRFSSFVDDTYGDYVHSLTSVSSPTQHYPSNEPQFVEYDSSKGQLDNPSIINQGTINYEDHHYYCPTFYRGDSTSSNIIKLPVARPYGMN